MCFLFLENDFSEIIYIKFGGRQIFSQQYFTLKALYYAQQNLKNRLANKNVMPKIDFEKGFCISKGDNPG